MTMHDQPRIDGSASIDASGIVLAAMLAEVRATASEAQERGFLIAVGRRLAGAYPLTGLVDLDELAAGMNRMLRRLDLGQVRLAVDQSGVAIEHVRSGRELDEADGAAPALLEGVYGGWFAELGSDRLTLKPVATSHDRLAFHYGR